MSKYSTIQRKRGTSKKLIISAIFAVLLILVMGFLNKIQATEKYGELYQKDGNYITGVLPYTTVEDLKNNLEMDDNSNFTVKDGKGNIVNEKKLCRKRNETRSSRRKLYISGNRRF